MNCQWKFPRWALPRISLLWQGRLLSLACTWGGLSSISVSTPRHGDLCLSSFYFFISSTLICLLLFSVVLTRTTSNKAVEAVPHAFSTSLSPFYQNNPVFRDIYPFISWRTACNRVWTSCRHFKLPILSFWFLRSCGSKSCPNGYYAITPARVFGQIQPSITKDQGLTIRHLVYKQFVPECQGDKEALRNAAHAIFSQFPTLFTPHHLPIIEQ